VLPSGSCPSLLPGVPLCCCGGSACSSLTNLIHRLIRESLSPGQVGHLPLFLSRLRPPARSRCGGSFLSQPCISYIGFPPTGRAKYLLRWRHRFLL
jgi:hypothetical protein